MPLRLVSLDLDGTLIHPAIFNVVADAMGFGEPLRWSYEEYVAGRMSLEDAFHHDHKHFVGRNVPEMRAALRASAAWTPGIARAVERLHEAGLRVVVTTDQPRFLAEATRDLFGVDDLVCSEAEVRHDRVTGVVHPAFEKWPNLERHLRARGIPGADVAHVGNGTNDIPVFERVGLSIAVNALHPSVDAAAAASIARVADFGEVADILLSHQEK
jgi:phosphoserine phosphatase